MSARLQRKPSIAIVGAGNLATTLALALHARGYRIDEVIFRPRRSSSNQARALARGVGASAVHATRAQLRAEVIWLCVPDSEIAKAANSLVSATNWKGKVTLHSSGALTSGELDSLRRCGAAVASAHPLMTFVRGSRPSLEGVPFAIEGDSKALKVARSLIRDLRGLPFSIQKNKKEAYHAWGMFASPLLIALLAETERIADAAGIKPRDARGKMLPILRQTLNNYERLGAAGSFSGPIMRGDVETVRKHLQALQSVPNARQVYLALARASLLDLPVKNRSRFAKLLRAV
jgi:predicted short-subunit dehydrogenase-like oxidoreductase (DUF2520 family)